jgi:hypothetical protein
MSQKDRKPSLDDTIIDILKKHGALSINHTTNIINRERSLPRNRKTIERHIRDLRSQGKVVANPPVGREQTYSVIQKPLPMSEFFINQFWKNLDDVRRENISNSVMAYVNLHSLFKMLPPALNEKLKPDIQAAEQETEKVFVDLASLLNVLGIVSPGYVQGNPDVKRGVQVKVRAALFDLVENLIARVSALLHEEFERLHGDKEKRGEIV